MRDTHVAGIMGGDAPEHDPDIELMPFFALSHRFFSSLRSTYYDRIMDPR
jgi:delta8-fatty-acid desaturase